MLREVGSVIRNVNEHLQQWVHERGRLTQIVIGAMVSTAVGGLSNTVGAVVKMLSSNTFVFSETQLLILIVGVICGQTFIQSQKFNQLGHIFRDMDDTPATRADGGGHVDTGDEARTAGPLGNGTSGGGFFGGAIAGAGIGSSLGLGGVVGGAIFGAVLGDVIESLTIEY